MQPIICNRVRSVASNAPGTFCLAAAIAGIATFAGVAMAQPAPNSARAGMDWWSLQSVRRPIPPTNNTGTVSNPIDAFVSMKLKENGLVLSEPAQRGELIRRLSFDLLGLPPSPREVEDFLAEGSPDAYEKQVDRMLASPHYGERWARHWLDVARFGESHGFERDQLRPNAWRYRDWVVQAFNSDLPYNEFARMQIAGDVLYPGRAEGMIATGFLVAGAYDQVGQTQQSAAMRAVVRQDEMEDLVGTTSQTFLGLTTNCARCHDHKFDPIKQAEYYRFAAALAGVQSGERDLPSEPLKAEADARSLEIKNRIDVLSRDIAQIEESLRSPANIAAPLSASQKEHLEQSRLEITHLQTQRGRAAAMRMYCVVPATPAATHVLKRGNAAQEEQVVSPGGIAAVQGVSADFGIAADAPDSARRAKLAEWIASEHNPLFARVLVNRLWQYHFGTGLVETPNDFGFNGGRPSHPELLDWLASELVDRGWSLKQMQRLIVTSATYRQASHLNPEAAKVDATDRYLWRFPPRRLEAEEIRDTVLQVAGEMNSDLGGPGYEDYFTFTKNTQFYEMHDYVGASFNRRSVYRTWVRSGRSALLDVFDCPDPSTRTPHRAVTITPLQALALQNDSFILRMSDRFAERLIREAGDDPGKNIALAYTLAFSRPATGAEIDQGRAFILKHGMAAWCRVLFNSNEFAYID